MEGKGVVALTSSTFDSFINSDVPVIVDFWADWCGPCKMVAPTIEEISKEYEGKLKVCKLNVDGAPNAASKYQVMSIPTLVIFKNGSEVDRIIGAMSKSEIVNKINQYI